MRGAFLVAAMLVLTTAGVAEPMVRQDTALAPTAAAPPATLVSGDVGSATLSLSATGATVAISGLPVLADNALQIDGAQAGWEIHAKIVSATGFVGGLDTITVALDDGTLNLDQIIVAAGTVVQSQGSPVTVPTATNVELLVVGVGAGEVNLQLVLAATAGGATALYDVTITVT